MPFKLGLSLAATAATLIGIAQAPAHAADTLTDFLKQSSFSGTLRSYYFNRFYSSDTQAAQPNQSAFSIGGIFNARTAPFFGGFSVVASLFTAHSLGANNRSDGLIHIDQTLAGQQNSISALGQAYVQYQNDWLLARAGDQVLKTPWMPDSDSRMLPASYQGFFADAKPIKNLDVYALRIFRWKSRTSADYYQNNLYYAPTYDGDNMRGGIPAPSTSINHADTQGALAFGTAYENYGVKANVWYYSFQQIANMIWNDTTYTLKTGTGFDPFVGGQFIREWKGNSLLNGTSLYKITSSNGVNNRTYGFKGGLNSHYGQLMASYTNIANKPGAVGDGAIISPYTVGYTTDPLDTSSMIRGEVDMGPGHAWKLRYATKFFNDQLSVATAFTRYYSNALGNSNDAYFDVTWFPGGALKGLSLRNRLEDAIAATPSLGLNPGKSKFFIYDRVQIQYEF